MKYTFIKDNGGIFPIEKMCKVLEVGLRCYYYWKQSSTSKRKLKEERFKELLSEVYFEFKQRYGVLESQQSFTAEDIKYHELP